MPSKLPTLNTGSGDTISTKSNPPGEPSVPLELRIDPAEFNLLTEVAQSVLGALGDPQEGEPTVDEILKLCIVPVHFDESTGTWPSRYSWAGTCLFIAQRNVARPNDLQTGDLVDIPPA